LTHDVAHGKSVADQHDIYKLGAPHRDSARPDRFVGHTSCLQLRGVAAMHRMKYARP
jgi:hypothetical protein